MRLGVTEADDTWLEGGLVAHGLHEFYMAGAKETAALNGFVLLLAALRQHQHGREIIWAREVKATKQNGHPYGPGLAELGIDTDRMTLLALPDAKAVLRAALDATRDAAVSAVLIELGGKQPLLDLTATRRFALAAAENDTMALLSRGTAKPSPSAAHTRWQVAAAPSRALEAHAPGVPAFALELLRQRGGRDGLRLIMEWDRDTASFRIRSDVAGTPPLSRPHPAVVIGGAGGERRSRAA
jgi:protein ImuA